MAKAYFTIITHAGRKKLAELVAQKKKLELVEAAIGDGGGEEYEPVDTQSALKGEKWRGPINHLAPDPNNPLQLIAEVVVPAEVGDFYAREIGLLDADGMLFAIGNLAETYKPTLPSGSTKQLNIRTTLATSNAANIRLVIDPNVTLATRQWTEDQLDALGLGDNAPTRGIFDLNDAKVGSIVSVHGTEGNAAPNHWPTTGVAAATLVWYNAFTYGRRTRLTQWATQAFSGGNQSRTWVRHRHDDVWSAWKEIATTESVKAAGLQFGGLSTISVNEAFGARVAGRMIIAPANGQILTLPPAASVEPGDTIPVRVTGGIWDGVHLHRRGEDVISDGLSVVTSILLQAGSEVEFVSDGVATWYAGGSGAYHAHLVGKNFYATLNAGTSSKLFTPDLIVYRGVYLVVPYYCGLQLTAGGDSYFLHASVDFISGRGEAHSTNQYHTTPQSYNWPPFALRVHTQTATIRCRVSFEGDTNSAGLITNFGDNRGNFAFFGARIA